MQVRTHGLLKKPEYNDLTGTVKSQVEGGRWCIVLDKDGRELALKPDNFTQFQPDGCDGPDIDYLENGAVVCKAHRLEVCGACGMDFRVLNSENGVSVPEPEPFSIRAKKLGAHDEGLQNLDPSRLPAIVDTRARKEWGGRGPLTQAFTQTFSIMEKSHAHQNKRPTIDQDISLHVRETHLSIASTFESDKCRVKFVQDAAQSMGICILFLGAYEAGAEGREQTVESAATKPVILVWYQCNRVTDSDFASKMKQMSSALARAKSVGVPIDGEVDGIGNATADRKEIDALKILLDHNAKLLSKEWLAKNKPPPTFTASFITPLKKRTLSHEDANASARVCICGAPNPKHKCTKCSSVWYCQKSCQVADWKSHKKVCKSPQERASDPHTVIVRVGRHDPVLEAMGLRYLFTASNHAAASEAISDGRQSDMFQPLTVPEGEGVSFIAKIQTPPSAGSPMMVYNKGKNFQTLIHPGNVSPEGYQRLFHLIQTQGLVQGRKGYFSAALQERGTELHIYASSLLPAQSW
jgi:hypothetical protein